jgi:hypothetical protein
MTLVPPRLLHHAAIMLDALTLLLGGPTRMVMRTIPSLIMGGLAWQKGGLFLAIGGLDRRSVRDFVLMKLILLLAMGGIMGGLPFIIRMSPPVFPRNGVPVPDLGPHAAASVEWV